MVQAKGAVEFSEKIITDALNSNYIGNSRYRLANAYIFKYDWESDFFVQKQNGYCYEFEVKISRSDFFSDKKKVTKHLILSTGKYYQNHSEHNPNSTCFEDRYIKVEKEVIHDKRPNKFYYVVPAGMITVEDLPPYAGLMTFDGFSITTIKEAPFIHKIKHDLRPVLCDKFYHYWLDLKHQLRLIKIDNDYLTEKLNKLTQPSLDTTSLTD